jgi:hypothetical protein
VPKRAKLEGMAFGAALVLLVTGAILVARVSAKLAGIEGRTLGIVLLVAGIAVLALAVARRSSFGGPVTIGRRRDE